MTRRRSLRRRVLLLLRPTESATLFTQQLGRGLRRAKGKSHLTVIDLIGQHRAEFRFEDRLRAIVDPRRGRVADQVERGFPFLPAGCAVELDRKSRGSSSRTSGPRSGSVAGVRWCATWPTRRPRPLWSISSTSTTWG